MLAMAAYSLATMTWSFAAAEKSGLSMFKSAGYTKIQNPLRLYSMPVGSQPRKRRRHASAKNVTKSDTQDSMSAPGLRINANVRTLFIFSFASITFSTDLPHHESSSSNQSVVEVHVRHVSFTCKLDDNGAPPQWTGCSLTQDIVLYLT